MASRLKNRISMAGASPTLAGVVSKTPMTTPIALVTYYPVCNYPWGQSGVLTYEDLQPLWSADGSVLPAASNSGWGPVRPAGRG
jgi:hypothetical protein